MHHPLESHSPAGVREASTKHSCFIQSAPVFSDTEMEAEVEPSIEAEQRLIQEAEEKRRREAELEKIAVAALAQQRAAEADAAEEAERKEFRAVQEAAERERIRQVQPSGDGYIMVAQGLQGALTAFCQSLGTRKGDCIGVSAYPHNILAIVPIYV